MKIGSRLQVYRGTRAQTSGGLKKSDLAKSKNGKIVSKRKQGIAKRKSNLKGYLQKKGVQRPPQRVQRPPQRVQRAPQRVQRPPQRVQKWQKYRADNKKRVAKFAADNSKARKLAIRRLRAAQKLRVQKKLMR